MPQFAALALLQVIQTHKNAQHYATALGGAPAIVQGFAKITGDFGVGLLIAFDQFASVEPSISNVVEVLFSGALESRTLKRKHCLFDDVPRGPSFHSMRLKVYLMGVVRGLSLVSRTKTASSFAGSVLLALWVIEWIAPGGSDQLSPAR